VYASFTETRCRWVYRKDASMNRLRSSLALLCGCLALSGCSKFDLRKGIPWIPGEDGELERPMKIVAVWTDTIMSQGEEKPVRGFGGRLMFYAREDAKPVKVEGSLVVYGFDETNRDPRNVRPERKWVFSEEEFAKHHSESKIGHSYSVWLPWDRIGGPQAEISLVARFTPKEGGMVVGEQQTILLPGAAVPKTAPLARSGSREAPSSAAGLTTPTIQQATFVDVPPQSPVRTASEERHAAMRKEPERMTTTTIPISAGPGNRFPVSTGVVPPLMPAAAPHAAKPVSSQETVAWAQPSLPVGQSPTHFGPGRHRPLGAPIARLDRDHGPWRPNHAAPPSAAQATHRSAPAP
jgi:hypothetical protein